jgi:hypothetical protein
MQAPYADDQTVEVPRGDAAPTSANRCAVPDEGCPCVFEQGEAPCGVVTRTSGSYVSCSKGKRRCLQGAWGPCEGDRAATKGAK